MSDLSCVWLKKDLRVSDHRPLYEAAQRGAVVILYIYEPEVLGAADFAARHLAFANDCLREVDAALRERGGRLIIRRGEASAVLEELRRETGFTHLYAHEETGNAISYARDRRVRAWAKEQNVAFKEFPQTGVVRGLRSRDGWSRTWEARMREELISPPPILFGPNIASVGILSAEDLNLVPDLVHERQRGGEPIAHHTLYDFLSARGAAYSGGISSPASAAEACSRLSPYLAWGALSMKQVYQATLARQAELREAPEDERRAWGRSLRAFSERLHWHCHFMQKLEDEPALEHHNLHRGHDGLRESDWNQEHFDAWAAGQTGYPMIDACMRQLRATGWINFRMRALLMSFASYDLWLHWRPTGLELARLFVDYEPGIHFSQAQMQSGTTGINTLRMYNPTKQGQDHDPRGEFIRRWVPELAAVPLERLHEPWRMSAAMQEAAGCQIGRHYPAPIVDHLQAIAAARARFRQVRGSEQFAEEKRRVMNKHGSRKIPGNSRGAGKTRTSHNDDNGGASASQLKFL